MKIYGITIQPTSSFGTPLKGDTLFGHFCWQAAEDPDLLTGGLDHWIPRYPERPFAVFSSAWPVLQQGDKKLYALARPAGLAPETAEQLDRRQRIERNKADKKRKWLLVDETMRINITNENLQTDEDLFTLFMENRTRAEAASLRLLSREEKKLCTPVTQAHNSINRLSMSTGSGEFAPFTHDNFQYLPGLALVIFVAVEEDAVTADQLQTAFERIGSWGFGRDASAGLGRFTVKSVREHSWPQAQASDTACFTLGPVVPPEKTFIKCYGEPFTRFGRHGSALACSGNPFKKPVIMADEAAVLYPVDREVFASPWIGTAVTDVSVADKRTVVQGYTLYLPC